MRRLDAGLFFLFAEDFGQERRSLITLGRNNGRHASNEKGCNLLPCEVILSFKILFDLTGGVTGSDSERAVASLFRELWLDIQPPMHLP